ncbi:hypothetical protein FOZ62_001531 [Perkinsus olseni]|uniref:BTB domain-containing protein n=1 Tax=Perkinsus olseni TaxID=32597 RepID=A0A7J6P244_PEROL|nr:hypothetical protein FOZ62_001531 [Perkinsus olseni]
MGWTVAAARPLGLLLVMTLPLCGMLTDLFDCVGVVDDDRPWRNFSELSQAAFSDNWTVSPQLAASALRILPDPHLDLEHALLEFSDSLVRGGPTTTCLYGILTALYVKAIVTGSGDSARIAVWALGKGGVLDFLDSSRWPVRYVDLLAAVQNPASHPFPHERAQSHHHSRAPPLSLTDLTHYLPASHGRGSLAVHAIGTHPSLTLEPVQRVRDIMASAGDGVEVRVHYDGIRYRCEYFRELCESGSSLAGALNSNEDGVDLTMDGYRALAGGLVASANFNSDLYICTGPFILCGIVHNLTAKPMLVYVGLPLLWKAPVDLHDNGTAREELWDLSLGLARSERAIVAANNPLSALQIEAQLGLLDGPPVVRVRADWASRYRWSPDVNRKEVLMVYRHRNEWALRRAIERILSSWEASHGRRLSVSIVYSGVGVEEELTFTRMSRFWAIFFFPWEHATISLYEFYSMGIPIFLPTHTWMMRLMFQPDGNLASTHPARYVDYYDPQSVSEAFGSEGPPLGFGGPFGVHQQFHYLGYSDFTTLPQLGQFNNIQDMLDTIDTLDLLVLSDVSRKMCRHWQMLGRQADHWWHKALAQHSRRAKRSRAKEEELRKAERSRATKGAGPTKVDVKSKLLGHPDRSRSGNRDAPKTGTRDGRRQQEQSHHHHRSSRSPEPTSKVHPAYRDDSPPSKVVDKHRREGKEGMGLEYVQPACALQPHAAAILPFIVNLVPSATTVMHLESTAGVHEQLLSAFMSEHRALHVYPLLTLCGVTSGVFGSPSRLSPVDAAPVAGNSQAIDQTPFPLHPYDSENESERAGEEGPCSDSLAVLKLAPDANTTLLSEINRLRKAGTWCDVVLTSNDGVEFHAHKVVLSAFSTYLATLLSSSSGFREAIVMTSVTTNKPVVGDVLHLRLESLDSDLLRCIVDFAYGCDTTLPSTRLPELLLAAHSFEMRRILLPTAELLSNVLDTELCVRLLVECGPVLQDTGALWTAVSKYAAKRFGQLVVAPDFSRIPPSILMLLLLDDDLSGGISGSMVLEKGAIDRQLTEDQVMFALCKWSAARRDRGDSEGHLDSLLPLVSYITT